LSQNNLEREKKMASQESAQLARLIRQNVEKMNRLYQGLDEATASRAPEGRWSPKEILSHLCGPEGIGMVPDLQAILQQDTPPVDLDAGNSYYSGKRLQMSFAEILSQFNEEYGRMAELVAGLSDEQLARKAHIPLFKDLPMGEYPTLAMTVNALAGFHLGDHIKHMAEILQALGWKTPTTGKK
jgi:DinB superfamily